jgi:hypothetical protein
MTTQHQYEILRNELNEQQWRLYLGTEALKIGYGGISLVAKLSGADWKTVQRGVKELKGERARVQGRIRQVGGGRKRVTETDPTLQRDLEELLEPKGDPMSLIKWTTHSLTHLVKALARASASHQEDGAGRRTPRAGLFAQGQQENAGRCFSCRPRSTVWAHHDPV